MKYESKRFSVGSTSAEAEEKYRDNWERVFGKKEPRQQEEQASDCNQEASDAGDTCP